ncbi:MAG: hypothetical protein RLY43_131 [Bacteroidota bacterium]
MDDKFSKLESKIDKLDERLDGIDKTLIRQEGHLSEHIRRTGLLETQTERLFDEIKPIKKHVTQVEGVIKFVGFLSIVVGLLSGLIAVIKVLFQ